jgi:phenylacetate-CoA ligase
MPLLRYWTNDLTYLYYDDKGKRNMVKMGPIIGRADDMLIVRGVNVYPSQIEEVFKFVPGILPNYYLKPIYNEQMVVALAVDVEVEQEWAQSQMKEPIATELQKIHAHLAHQVAAEIKKRVGITTEVTIHLQDSLPKCEAGKINRIIT